MKSPIADKFRNGELKKPITKKEEFFKGGFFAMRDRLKIALQPFPGAFTEFKTRAEDLTISGASIIIFDYIEIEQTEMDSYKMNTVFI